MPESPSASGAPQWTEGAWAAAVTPSGGLLLPPEVPQQVVNELWGLLRTASPSLTAVLDRLVTGTGGHLARIPDFVLVVRRGQGLQAALRGAPVLLIDGERIEAGAVTTWREVLVATADSVILLSPEEARGVARPAVDAVLRASRLVLWGPTSTSFEAGSTLVDRGSQTSRRPAGPGPHASAAMPFEPGLAPPVTAPAVPSPAVPVPPAPAPPVSPPISVPSVVSSPLAPAPSQGRVLPSLDPSDPVLTSATPSAPASSPERATASSPDVLGPGSVPSPWRPAPTPPMGAAREDGPEPRSNPSPTPPMGVLLTESPGRLGDHDGWTVSGLSDTVAEMLFSASSAESGWSPSQSATPLSGIRDSSGVRMALSVICPQGHANPTNYVSCRICGAELSQPARMIPCPSLGHMLVSSGGCVELDRPVLVGRLPEPKDVPQLAGTEPNVVTVPSPEFLISRNHLYIELDEWSVLAHSMSSSNGTTLRRPGSAPMRLTAAEPVLLTSGDLLDLGDGQSLLFEDLP